jgi:ribonuclease HI
MDDKEISFGFLGLEDIVVFPHAFLDGASKNNSGVAGVGGSIHDLGGRQVDHYALGLGNVSKNLAEAYSLWCGIVIVKEEGIKSLTVLGDSMLVIRVVMDQANLRGEN